MGNHVVARYRDGRLVKGLTLNFDPDAGHCHIVDPAHRYEEGTRVEFRDLKAIFFVKTLAGQKDYQERRDFGHLREYGRKVRVKFKDGEEMLGVVVDPDRHKQGFFVYTADPDDNNDKTFAVRDAVASLEYLDPPPAHKPE